MITQERYKEMLDYDHSTGVFKWKITRGKISSGSNAGTITSRGYVTIMVDGQLKAAHRIAWLYVYGAWPVDQIDHINGIKSDNRIANLREANNAQNAMNRKTRIDSKSGVKGVRFIAKRKKWRAEIDAYGKNRTIGYFDSLQDAKTAIFKERELVHATFANHGI